MKGRKSHFVRAIALTTMGVTLLSGEARAALFGSSGLDPSFCQMKAIRKTVIYVDDMMMVDGKTDWAIKISDKLRATLTPGEPVSVVRLSPATGQSVEVMHDICWPNYTAEERAEIEKQNYLFSKSPLSTLSDQQTFFFGALGAALTKIYTDAKRPEADARIAFAKPPTKQILRAIVSDEGRFSNSQVTIRAILYSDMMENSDLGTVYKPTVDKTANFADKLGSHLRRSIFYAFGVASDVDGGQALQETSRAFWTGAINSMTGVIGGIGSDLNLSNDLPVKAYNFDLDLDFNGEHLDGRMSLLVDGDGVLVDSWAGFNRLTISGLSGTFRCQATACKLDGNPTTHLVTVNAPSERLTLSGKPETLTGRLGIPDTKNIFVIRASAVGS